MLPCDVSEHLTCGQGTFIFGIGVTSATRSIVGGWTLHYHRGHCPMQRLWRAASLRDGVGYTFVPFLQDMKNYADEIERIVESRE